MSDALTVAWPLPADCTRLAVVVRQEPSAVAYVVMLLDRAGEELARYVGRSGAHLWHQLLLPALRTYGAVHGLPLDVVALPHLPSAKIRL